MSQNLLSLMGHIFSRIWVRYLVGNVMVSVGHTAQIFLWRLLYLHPLNYLLNLPTSLLLVWSRDSMPLVNFVLCFPQGAWFIITSLINIFKIFLVHTNSNLKIARACNKQNFTSTMNLFFTIVKHVNILYSRISREIKTKLIFGTNIF